MGYLAQMLEQPKTNKELQQQISDLTRRAEIAEIAFFVNLRKELFFVNGDSAKLSEEEYAKACFGIATKIWERGNCSEQAKSKEGVELMQTPNTCYKMTDKFLLKTVRKELLKHDSKVLSLDSVKELLKRFEAMIDK